MSAFSKRQRFKIFREGIELTSATRRTDYPEAALGGDGPWNGYGEDGDERAARAVQAPVTPPAFTAPHPF